MSTRLHGMSIDEIINSIRADIKYVDPEDLKFVPNDYLEMAEAYVEMLVHRRQTP